MLSKLSIMLMIAYPIVAYIVLWLKQPIYIIAYLLFIFFLIAVEKCRDKKWGSGISLLILVGIISVFIQQAYIQHLFFLPPILILITLFLLFSQSLLKEKIPLITRYAHLLGETPSERRLRYNKSLTVVWTVFILLMLITSIVLAIFSSVDTWSLFTHVVSYILMGLLFVIEFFYRKHVFAGEVEGGFFQFISKLIKIRPHHVSK